MKDQLQDRRWKTLALALEKIQSLVFKSDENKTEGLLCHLLDLELPFPGKSLSIIYRPYGARELQILAYKGKEFHGQSLPEDFSFIDGGVVDSLSRKATKEQQIEVLKTEEECQREGLYNIRNAILCPIRLTSEKNLGVFILTNDQHHNQLDGLETILHTLSDRMAYYIRHNMRKRRNHYFVEAQYDLLNNEYETGKDLVNKYLEKMKGWFTEDHIHLLLKHPLDTNKFVLATKDNKLIENWRVVIPSSVDNLSAYLRQDEDLFGNDAAGEALTRNTHNEVKKLGITGGYASYAVAPLQLKHKVILGYVVITNNIAEQAFEYDEDVSIDAFSDFVAQLIGIHRNDKYRKAIRGVREFNLEDPQCHAANLKKLYEYVTTHLQSLYGIKELAIARYTHSNLGLDVEHADNSLKFLLDPSKEEIKSFYRHLENGEKKHFNSLYTAVLDIVTTSHRDNASDQIAINEASSRELPTPLVIYSSNDDQHYFVSPMRTKTHSAGCFVFAANNIGGYTARNIDDISDTLGHKLDGYGRWKRYLLLNNFSKETAQIKNPSVNDVINLAEDFISKAMYTDNLYIALYNHETKKIRFVLARKEGKPWTEENGFNTTIHGSVRKLDESKQGKTEFLLLNSESGTVEYLLHTTKAESLEWYHQSGRQEFAGDPLASWVGVPIYSDKGVIGVIATYHDKLDYIFSDRDVFFLRQIAASIATMLQALSLKDTNIKLENAQGQIAEQQHVLSTALLSQDLTHRLNNTIGAVSINVDQAIRDIEYVRDTNDFSPFDFTTEALQDVDLILKELVKEIRNISNNTQQTINIIELIEKVTAQIAIANRLKEKNASISTQISSKTPTISGHYRTLFNTFAALVENAAHAVLDARTKGDLDSRVMIKSSYDNKSLTISVIDNGTPIPSYVEPNLFQYGISSKDSSGFGLWRAKSVVEKLGGSLTYAITEQEKTFSINIPLTTKASSKGAIYILDDERSWRKILERWITEAGYEVSSVGTTIEMLDLLNINSTAPETVLLDISLDSEDGANYDGLGLISCIKEKFPQTKIIIVSGYADAAQSYESDVDAILSKINNNGVILSPEELIKVI